MRQEKVLLLSSVFILFLGLQIQMQQMFVLLYLFGLLYEQSLVTHIRIEAPKDSAVDISSWYQQHDMLFRQWLTAEQFLLIDHRMNWKTDDRPLLARFLMLT